MLGSPPRPPRVWPDPPPAHTKVEDHVMTSGFTRSVSQVHQVITEETSTKTSSRREACPCKPITGWSSKGVKDGGCSRTTPRSLLKSSSDSTVPTPCQVQEVTTSSKTDIQGTSSGGIPVGIAIARQRVQQSTPSPLTVQLTTCQERPVSTQAPVPSWSGLALPHWQFQGAGIAEQALPIQQSSMGLQLGRDPVTGQLLLLPTGIPDATSVQRAAVVWPGQAGGHPPLQVMQQPQPLLVDHHLVTLTAPHHAAAHDRRRALTDTLTGGVIHLPTNDFGRGGHATAQTAAAPQPSLLIHPASSMFGNMLVQNIPFATTANAAHQNSLLLTSHLTEQSLINQGGVVISNHHLENTVINPQIINMETSGFTHQPSILHNMSPSVVISSHTETNSAFLRPAELTPMIATAVENQVVLKSSAGLKTVDSPLPVVPPSHQQQQQSLAPAIQHVAPQLPPPPPSIPPQVTTPCVVDQATSPPSLEEKEMSEEEEELLNLTVVADAQNQTETPSNSESEEDSKALVIAEPNEIKEEQSPSHEDDEEETSVVKKETIKITTQIIEHTTHTQTWTTNQSMSDGQVDGEGEVTTFEEKVEKTVSQEVTEEEPYLSGLELLSNSIAQHEQSSSEPEIEHHQTTSVIVESEHDETTVLTAERSSLMDDSEDDDDRGGVAVDSDDVDDMLGGGLGLLCKVAEQHLNNQHDDDDDDEEGEDDDDDDEEESNPGKVYPVQRRIELPTTRIHPLQPTEKAIPLKDVFKAMKDSGGVKSRKIKPLKIKKPRIKKSEQKCDDDSPPVEPPVLEPWSAVLPLQRISPPLAPPTLTPNKKRRCSEISGSSTEHEAPPLLPAVPSGIGGGGPLKKRKVGRPKKQSETITEVQAPEMTKTTPHLQQPLPSIPFQHRSAASAGVESTAVVETDEFARSSKNKIKPKLKAEAKIKEETDEPEDELELTPLKKSWRSFPAPTTQTPLTPTNNLSATSSITPPSTPESPPLLPSTTKKEKFKVPPKKVRPIRIVEDEMTAGDGDNETTTTTVAVVTPPQQSTDKKFPPLPDCRLTEEHLKTIPCAIMMYHGGHLYPAQVTDVKAEGIYEVKYSKNHRARRPIILCTEELLKSAVIEVKVDGLSLPAGTRVCTYWSQEYSYMYNGNVSSSCAPEDKLVEVEYDDGDNGKISRDDIRLLPSELNLVDYDPEPSSPLMNRRRRNNSSNSDTKDPPIKGSLSLKSPLNDVEEEDEDDIKTSDAMEVDSPSATHQTPPLLSAQMTTSTTTPRLLATTPPMPLRPDPEASSEAGSDDTPPVLTIKNIVEDFFQSEKERKRLKKEKRRRLLESGVKFHKHHKHKEGCKTHHKQTELRIKDSTVTDPGNEKGPLVTTIAKPVEAAKETVDTKETEEAGDASPKLLAKGSKSKIAAFLPARHEMWSWKGDGAKRGRGSGPKGKCRKLFYKAIQRGSDVINVGDCAVFVSTGRPDRPFIGQVESFWASQRNSMSVKVAWFYHPEETVGAPEKFPYPGALFRSPHTDINDVQTISHKCEVVSLAEFAEKVTRQEVDIESVYENQEVYYCVGFYDPHDTSIKYEPGALVEQPQQ